MKKESTMLMLMVMIILSIPLMGQNSNIAHVGNFIQNIGTPKAYAVKDGFAYAAGTTASLTIIDISDPDHPLYAGQYNLPDQSQTKSVHISGNTCTLFTTDTIYWLNISTPLQRQIMSRVTFAGDFVQREVRGNFVYFISSSGHFYCWDATNPNAPVLATSLTINISWIWSRFAIAGNRIYLSGTGDWIILDIINPYSIAQLGTLPGTSNRHIAGASQQYVFCKSGLSDIYVYEINQDDELVNPLSIAGNCDGVESFCANEDYIVYTTVYASGPAVSSFLVVRYLTDLNNFAYLPAGGYGSTNSIGNNHLFITKGGSFKLFTGGQNGMPLTLRGEFTRGFVSTIRQNSDYIFVKVGYHIKTLGNFIGGEPFEISYTTVEDLKDFYVSDTRAVISTASYDYTGNQLGSDYLRAFAISPDGALHQQISLFGSGYRSSYLNGGHIIDNFALLAYGGDLNYYDLSDLSNMTLLSSISPSYIRSLFVYGNRAYCGANASIDYRFWIIDISNPNAPIALSFTDLPSDVLSIGIRHNRAYVLCAGTLFIYDISNPAAPSLISSPTIDYSAKDLVMGQNHMIILFENRISVYDLGNGPIPILRGTRSLSENTRGMVVRDNYVYVSQGSQLGVFDISAAVAQCTSVSENILPAVQTLIISPNPFQKSASIIIETKQNDKAKLSVYNLKGQKVYDLTNNVLSTGQHTITWNGTDDGGNALPNGVYLIKGTIGKQAFSRKITILK